MKHLYYVFSLQIGLSAMTLYAMNCQDRGTLKEICSDLQQFCENARETAFEKAKKTGKCYKQQVINWLTSQSTPCETDNEKMSCEKYEDICRDICEDDKTRIKDRDANRKKLEDAAIGWNDHILSCENNSNIANNFNSESDLWEHWRECALKQPNLNDLLDKFDELAMSCAAGVAYNLHEYREIINNEMNNFITALYNCSTYILFCTNLKNSVGAMNNTLQSNQSTIITFTNKANETKARYERQLINIDYEIGMISDIQDILQLNYVHTEHVWKETVTKLSSKYGYRKCTVYVFDIDLTYGIQESNFFVSRNVSSKMLVVPRGKRYVMVHSIVDDDTDQNTIKYQNLDQLIKWTSNYAQNLQEVDHINLTHSASDYHESLHSFIANMTMNQQQQLSCRLLSFTVFKENSSLRPLASDSNHYFCLKFIGKYCKLYLSLAIVC